MPLTRWKIGHCNCTSQEL